MGSDHQASSYYHFCWTFLRRKSNPFLLPLLLQWVLLLHREKESGGGKIRPNNAWMKERECLCVKFRERVLLVYIFSFLCLFCSCALLSCQFVNDDPNFLYSPYLFLLPGNPRSQYMLRERVILKSLVFYLNLILHFDDVIITLYFIITFIID